MGTYNSIMTTARTVQSTRRGLRIDAPHVAGREEASFPFACPVCAEGSAAQTSCPRCDVPMREVATTVQLPRRSDARDATVRHGAMAGLAVGVGVGVPLLLYLGTLSMDAASLPTPVWILAASFFSVVALAPALHHRLAPYLARRADARRLRDRAAARATLARRATPSEAKDHLLLAIRGRVRVEDGGLVVEDGVARVRVPVCESVRVIADDGERHALSDGEEVEVVGVGAHRRGAGRAYRDAKGDFELDGAHPIDVWVR